MIPLRPAPTRHSLRGLAALLLAAGCATYGPKDWGTFDILTEPLPSPPRTMSGIELEPADYERFVRWGEQWFRYGDFGTERAITDIAGVMLGTVEVPCASGEAHCYTEEPVLGFYVKALDALDGVEGNLFAGNGGKDGTGFTNDLVIRFPKGTRLYGGVPVPEEVHTGLDVDAGDAWPIGVEAVPVPDADDALPYLPEPSALGVGPADPGRVRFRLSCALCHYSLDVDMDGQPDLRSTKLDEPTPGSPWRPEDGWGVGNQDLAIGWVIALAANPLLLAPVFSGPIGPKEEGSTLRWMEWVRDNYATDGVTVRRNIVAGLLTQPRGYADVVPDARNNLQQLPNLYTWHNWPSNTDGAAPDATDRNNIVWTGTLDFTGLIGTCSERAGSVALPWEHTGVLSVNPCETLVDMMTRYSPVGVSQPERLPEIKADILGTSDGVPGMINPADVYVMKGSPAIPDAVYDHPDNIANNRQRTAEDMGGDAKQRGSLVAILGYRIRTPQHVREAIGLDAIVAKYPGLDPDEFWSNSVNLMLDWMRPPANQSALLAASREQVPAGRKVFQEAGCESCHRGPFGTDNVLHPLSESAQVQYGGPRAPTTAGWRVTGRGQGPAIGTDPQRVVDGRTLRRLVSPPYDPETGLPTGTGGPLNGLLSVQEIGIKTTILTNLWASAPFLHEGSVGVAIRPGAAAAGTDLRKLLARAGSADMMYGMGQILAARELDHAAGPRPDAALSLQALLLRSERERVVKANTIAALPVPPGATWKESPEATIPTTLSWAEMGAAGVGHDFYVQDVPGGADISALVAYLLSLDDCPRELPGGDPAVNCGW